MIDVFDDVRVIDVFNDVDVIGDVGGLFHFNIDEAASVSQVRRGVVVISSEESGKQTNPLKDQVEKKQKRNDSFYRE